MIIKKRNKSGVMCYWDDEQNASKVKSRKESAEQKEFISWVRFNYPEHDKTIFAPINESQHSQGEAVRMGLTRGVSDTLMMCNGAGAIEIKRSRKRDSSVSKEQVKFTLGVESAGGFAVVAYGALAAKEALKDYLNK